MYQPPFTITPSINSNIAEFERIRSNIERSRILPSQEIILRRRALVEATRSSTGIEGNPLNKDQIEKVLQGKHVGANDRFITEVKNYKEALVFIRKRLTENRLFTKPDILRIHALVMKGLLERPKIGAWRKTPIFVVNVTKKGEEVQYEGPAAQSVSVFIDDLLSWIHKTGKSLHPVLIAGILHYEFVSIHPFTDGNGRVTRLLTMWYLCMSGYGLRDILVPESYYFANREAYYGALNQAKTYNRQRIADQTPWLEYFVNGLAVVARDALEKITFASVLPVPDTGKPVTLDEADFRIVDFALSMGKVTIQDVIDMLEIPKRTAQRKLKHLTDIGIFVQKEKGPASHYVVKQKK